MIRSVLCALVAGLAAGAPALGQVTPVRYIVSAPVATQPGTPVVFGQSRPASVVYSSPAPVVQQSALPAPTPGVVAALAETAPVQVQYITGPDGVLRPLQPAPMMMMPAPAVHPAPDCCPCPNPSGECNDVCGTPQIIPKPGTCPPSRVCVPVPVKITPGPEPVCVNIPFYVKCVDSKAKVKVPTRTVECREEIRFKEVVIPFICCDVKVCVPCEKCQVRTEKCVEVEQPDVAIRACRRQDGTIDVSALNVPGLPTEYMLQLKMTVAAFSATYPGAAVP